jgi:tetratricopeptide (TPR) repeat protein/predicted Ser/Thr protein kinase
VTDADDGTVAGTVGSQTRPEGRAPRKLVLGDPIGRYLIVSKLGAGGMGVVYGAYDPELDRKVAIKLLRSADEGSSGHARLLREAQAMAKLGHPNVIAVHDVGEHDGMVFIAMEFVEGSTLSRWVEGRSPTWRDVLRVGIEAGRGLAAAHARALIHRDFKPDNVMVADDGRVRVMDFGLARRAEEPRPERLVSTDSGGAPSVDALSSDLTRAGAVMGTPAYMAPEQHSGLTADAATDQFAFCVTLYECLYAERPFAGESVAQIAFNVLQGTIRAAPAGTAVPGWVRRVVLRGLATDPAARWPSMDALLAALGRDPSRRRRAVTSVVGIGLIAVGGMTWQRLDRARAAQACEREATAIADDYDAARASDLARRFADSGINFASDTWARAAPHLDDWTRRWTDTRRDLCSADAAGMRTPALVAAGTECLVEQRLQLTVMLGLLEHAGMAEVTNAVASASGLPAPERCVDAGYLAEIGAVDRETSEARSAIRRQFGEFDALLAATHNEEALEVATVNLTAAQELGEATLAARARLDEGLALERLGRFEESAAVVRDAYHRAGAVGAERVGLRAAASLTNTVGVRLAHNEEGKWWADLARMHTERLGDAGGLDAAAAVFAIANVDGMLGHYEEAKVHYAESLRMRQEVVGLEHPAVAMSWIGVGSNALDLGDHAEARRALGIALQLREQAFGPDHPLVAEVLNNLGNVMQSTGDYEEAEAMFRRALALKEAALGPDHPDLAAPLNNLGYLYAMQSDYDAAEVAMERALALREAAIGADNPDLARQLTNLASIYRGRGDLDAAERTIERAVTLHEKGMGPDHPAIAITLVNYALLLKARKKYAEAAKVLERALRIQQRTHGEFHHDVAVTLANLGAVQLSDGRTEDARASMERALDVMAKVEVPPAHRALVEWELGALIERTGGDVDEARTLVTAAFDVLATRPEHAQEAELARQWLVDHPSGGSSSAP